jgi:organic radical activating enzyme
MIINTIYASYQGEVNAFGIGAPVIFVRTGGCPHRCYQKTLGILCDTPEALAKGSGEEMTAVDILNKVNKISQENGNIKLICFTGGDPLWRSPESLELLFGALVDNGGYKISVETSGTISPERYMYMDEISWVLDYKLKSAGIKQPFVHEILPLLAPEDIIKFIIYDHEDYNEFLTIVEPLLHTTKAKIAVGLFWGTDKLMYSELIQMLQEDKLFGRVIMNFQTHKLVTLYDTKTEDAQNLKVPIEI